MENCGMISEVGHEITEVVDEAKKQVELVGVCQERKLLNTCNLGGVR